MNAIARALLIAQGVCRAVPASVYLSFGAMSAAFITILGGPDWAPLASLLSVFCVVYGGWRSSRRYRALHCWTNWKL